MIRWIIILIVLFLVYRLVRRVFPVKSQRVKRPPAEIQDEMVQDPVCKTYVPRRLAVKAESLKGVEEFFCSPACRDKYLEESSGTRKNKQP